MLQKIEGEETMERNHWFIVAEVYTAPQFAVFFLACEASAIA